MTRIISSIVALFFLQTTLNGQDYKYGYLIEFTDKNNTEYSVDNPEVFLSQRAIQRRAKNSISVNEQDFPVNKNYTDSLLFFDAKLHVTSRWFNSAVFLTNSNAFVANAENCSFVSRVSLVYENPVITKKKSTVSKWNTFSDTAFYGDSYNQLKMCNAQLLHERNFLGNNIQIAVLDAGFWRVDELSCFKELWDSNRILGTWDFVEGNESVFEDHSHGMAVLSTMGGNLPGELMGSAPNASYYLYRTENAISEYPIEEENWIAGAEKADSAGADIITASLGYSIYDNQEMSHTYSDMDGKSTRITQGAEIAFTKGIFLINSAGNEGNNDWNFITAPSDGENVLCVGAVDKNSIIASFSSRGPSADNRIKPDLMAQGLATTLISSNGNVSTGNGTSFSCPLLAGMVACLWQALPHYSNKDLLTLVRKVGNKYLNPDNDYGYGIPNFANVLTYFGNNDTVVDGSNHEIYPNPFSNNFSVQIFLNKEQNVTMRLFNLQGKEIYFKKFFVEANVSNIININDLPKLENGCYFLKIEDNSHMFIQKIVKQ